MTRDPLRRDGISQHRTFFKWRPCCCCGLEFRRENGWEIKSYIDSGDIYLSSWSTHHYVCETCAPDRATAAKVADIKPWIPHMPKVAPPAPPRAR